MLDILIGKDIEDSSISFKGDMRSLVTDTCVVIAGIHERLAEQSAEAADAYKQEITKAVNSGIPFETD